MLTNLTEHTIELLFYKRKQNIVTLVTNIYYTLGSIPKVSGVHVCLVTFFIEKLHYHVIII